MNRVMTVWVLGCFVLMAGCVSTKEYRRSQSQTEKCQADREALSQQLDAANSEKAALEQATKSKEEEISKLKGTYEDLVGNLKNEIANGQIQVTQLRDKLTLNMVEKILFNSGQADIKPEGMKVLDRIAEAIKKLKDKDIRVEGYTDDVPLSPKLRSVSPTYWELSTARATHVVRYLQDKDGVDPSRLIAAGYGQFHPVASNDTPEGRAQNRRIDIVLVPHDVSTAAVSSPASPVPTPRSVP